MLVSVTRLQLRSLRFLPIFFVYSLRSIRQARNAGGFVSGWTASEWPLAFWTATTWRSMDAMRGYRNAAPHLQAMRKLLDWCDEASFVHWEEADAQPPAPADAYERMRTSGSVSKVRQPSPRQAAGRTVGDRPPARPVKVR